MLLHISMLKITGIIVQKILTELKVENNVGWKEPRYLALSMVHMQTLWPGLQPVTLKKLNFLLRNIWG